MRDALILLNIFREQEEVLVEAGDNGGITLLIPSTNAGGNEILVVMEASMHMLKETH